MTPLSIARRARAIGSLLRRRAAPPPVPKPQPQPPEGHPDNPLTPNLLARRRFAAALHDLATSGAEDALATIAELSAWRPGLAPEGAPGTHLEGLRMAARALPDNLAVRTSLAEALECCGHGEEARELAISVIRQTRPYDLLRNPDPAAIDAFRSPALAGMFFHSVDLGEAFHDGSPKTAVVTAREMLSAHWPDLRGKSVLDIGAFGGWFTFEAERRGAASVTANDYYSWMVDFPKVWNWLAEQRAAGLEANPYAAPYPISDPGRQPGRVVFDLTRRTLRSSAVPAFGPIETVEVEPHDIVLLLGVLYHSENPLGLLRRAYELTRELLIIETLSVEYTAALADPIWHFYRDLRGDVTTVWAPSSIALREALLKVGFRKVELLYGWDGSGYQSDWHALEARLWAHAYR